MNGEDYPRDLSLLSENQRLHEEVEAAEGKIRQLREALAKSRNYAREEVGRLEEAYERCRRDLQQERRRWLDAMDEVERLRKALRQIAEYDSDEAIFYVDIARAALDQRVEPFRWGNLPPGEERVGW